MRVIHYLIIKLLAIFSWIFVIPVLLVFPSEIEHSHKILFCIVCGVMGGITSWGLPDIWRDWRNSKKKDIVGSRPF